MGEERRATRAKGPSVIVVGVDATPASDPVLAEAVAAANARPRCSIHVVFGLDIKSGKRTASAIRELDARLDRATERLKAYLDRTRPRTMRGRALVGHVRLGEPAEAIVGAAIDLDAALIIVGASAPARRSRPVHGTISARTVATAPCNVLVVRPREQRPRSTRTEPECTRCVAARMMTNGADWWCVGHARKSRHPMHVFRYRRRLRLRTPAPHGGH